MTHHSQAEIERAELVSMAEYFGAGRMALPPEGTPVTGYGNEPRWDSVKELPDELPAVDDFDEGLLPSGLQQFVYDIAERMQVPPDFPAVALIAALSGAIGRRCVIQPKANDTGWVVTPNLWGALVGPPGVMKSPVLGAALRPLHRVEAEWRREHESEMQLHEQQAKLDELAESVWQTDARKQMKNGKPAPERPCPSAKKPKLRRLILNDATHEALHAGLVDNPAGVLVVRDELPGWWAQLDRQGREGERAFFLESWNGDSPFTFDRIGRGTLHVPACCVSMIGNVQPGRLRSYLSDALHGGPADDGLMQRFSLLTWPNIRPDWRYVDRPPDQDLMDKVYHLAASLCSLDVANQQRFLFDDEAQLLFVDWLTELEHRMRGEALHPALVAHLAKYRKAMPALALILHLAGEGAGSRVGIRQARQAAAWCAYLESHAKRVYSTAVAPELRAARLLADKIRHRKIGADGSFAARDVYMKNWSGLDKPDTVRKAAEVLADHGWVRRVEPPIGPDGGRPTARYVVNPGVWA